MIPTSNPKVVGNATKPLLDIVLDVMEWFGFWKLLAMVWVGAIAIVGIGVWL